MSGRSRLITLNNGLKMPALGLGVLDRSTRELTASAVEAAIVTVASYRAAEKLLAEGPARAIGVSNVSVIED
jgi:diketogulonate reductase-like aldo/keto reductase